MPNCVSRYQNIAKLLAHPNLKKKLQNSYHKKYMFKFSFSVSSENMIFLTDSSPVSLQFPDVYVLWVLQTNFLHICKDR